MKRYYGTNKYTANTAFAKRLKQEAKRLQVDPEVAVSLFNRRLGKRPYARQPEVTRMDDTGERMLAISEDPRAGFLPKTNAEKNIVLSWLDYLDNPNKPLGIVNQLREVLNHAQGYNPRAGRSFGLPHGVRALESITWEVGDFLLDAEQNRHALLELKSAVDQGQRPSIILADEFPEGHTGLTAFYRHQDINEFIKHGKVTGLNVSPLMARQDPPSSVRPKDDSTPGKRKTIYTQYTRPDRTKNMSEHVDEMAHKFTIRDIRTGIDEVIDDVEAQIDFHNRRIHDITKCLGGKSFQPVRDAVDIIRLQQLDAVA